MKERVDKLVSKQLAVSRNKAQALIEKGVVFADGMVIKSASQVFEEGQIFEIKEIKQYVSRGAYKLLGAIEKFNLDFSNLVVLDMGASTGGFSQVLLEHNAKKIYAVDVGRGELDESLASDIRIVNMEGCDVRNLSKEDVIDVDFIVGDLSFISLYHIFPKLNELFGKKECVLLFKPQFECGKEIAKKYKGVIKDREVHIKLLNALVEELKLYDWSLSNLCPSPIKGKSGNIEYLIHLNAKEQFKFNIKEVVLNAF